MVRPFSLVFLALALSLRLNADCKNAPGADIGAKINALIASLPNGGLIDCSQGFSATERLSTPIVITGKPVHLVFSPGTTVLAETGSASAVTIGEHADGTVIQGLNLNGSNQSAVGVAIRGAWYATVRDSRVYGFTHAGLRVSDESRGTYMWSLINVVAGDGPMMNPPAGRNRINLLVEDSSKHGVTFGVLQNFWSTYAEEDGIVLRNVTGGQVTGTVMIGGGSSYNRGNGLVLDAAPNSGMDINIQSADFESNGAEAIVDNENVFAIRGTSVFFSSEGNPRPMYRPRAQSVRLETSGESFVFSQPTQNTPRKSAMTIVGPESFQAGQEQALPPIVFRMAGVGEFHLEGVKTSYDQQLVRFRNVQSGRWFAWDAGLNRLTFDNRQFWTPGTSGDVRFPSGNTLLVGNDTVDTLSNKTIVAPKFQFDTTKESSTWDGFLVVIVNGTRVKIPYYR